MNPRQKVGSKRNIPKVKKKLKKGLLILEKDEWGSYKIIN